MVGVLLLALLLYILPQFLCLSLGKSPFGLAYGGGKIMTDPVTVSLLWFGTGWQGSGQQVLRNGINSLTPSTNQVEDSGVPTLRNWWQIIRQYRDNSDAPVTDRVNTGAECFYSGPQLNMTLDKVTGIARSTFNMTSIDDFGGNLTCTQPLQVDDTTVYLAMFSHTVMFSTGKEQRELMDFCSGSFPVEVSGGVDVKMAWVRAPPTSGDHCSSLFQGRSYLGPPNGDEKIDSVMGYVLATIAEEVTNQDGRGWISNDGSNWTVSSSCASIFQGDKDGTPLFIDSERNVSFNAVGLNGYRYIVQYIWDQKIRNCALEPSETCGSNALIFKRPEGYMSVGIIANHSNGMQPYPPNQKCQWKIQYPAAKFISFTINYFSIAADSDDKLMICQSDKSSAKCTILHSDENSSKAIKITGSRAFVEFLSGNQVSSESRGWELRYSTGLCDGNKDFYDHKGVVGYKSATGHSYVGGLSCRWILHGNPGTPVALTFTRINITNNFDFLAIYNGTTQQMANFSGIYLGSNLPLMNLTGEVMIAFATQTDRGEGWSAKFYISSPVDRSRKTLLMIIIIVTVAVLVMSISLALIMLALVRRRRKHTLSMDLNQSPTLIRAEVNGEESRIGEGPSSIVYRAVSTDGIAMAIKSPKELTSGMKLEEEILIKTSSHPNIISLVGYAGDCVGGRHLVFEFMARGSLSWNLKENGATLDWEKRLTIAVQISSAIQMLHMYLICHGNITSENILLDEYYDAKLGGFGAANYCMHDGINPEMPSEMAQDTYSFGLLLVELLKGKPLLNRFASDFFGNIEENNEVLQSQECLDARLGIPEEQCKIRGLAKLGDMAKWCMGGSPRVGGYESIPKIGDVVSGLKQVRQLFCSASR